MLAYELPIASLGLPFHVGCFGGGLCGVAALKSAFATAMSIASVFMVAVMLRAVVANAS